MIGHVGYEDNRESGEDTGEDLVLPLVGKGFLGRYSHHLFEECGGTFGIPDMAVEILSAMAIGTGCHHDDDTAVPAAGLGGAHAFNGLVNVLVQGITAVGGDHDVAFGTGDANIIRKPGAAGAVSLVEMT